MILGIDLGGTNVKAALVDDKGEIIKKSTIRTLVHEGRENVADRMSVLIKELCVDVDGKIFVGIGSPGSIEREEGIIRFSPNLPDWVDFNLKQAIEKRTGFETFIENDAKAAALGEKWFGSAQGCENFFVLTLGTGVGGGAITNGHLMIGGNGIGGELGHTVVDPNGPLCGCGNRGCLETYASNTGMRRMVMEFKKKYPASKIFDMSSDGNYGAHEIFQAYKLGDRLAELVVRKFCWGLGVSIGSLVNIFNPEKVILSGGISQASDIFLDEVRKTADEFTLMSMMGSYEIIPSTLRENAAILGAASVALERIKEK